MTKNNSRGNLPHFVLEKAKKELSHTKQEIIQAKQRIQEKYHDFLILLPQNVKLNDSFYTVTPDGEKLGIFSYDRGTYVSIEKPYVTVDGRIQMARDEHAELQKRLDIHPPSFVTLNDRLIVSVTVESEIRGSSTGTIEVGFDSGVDRSNPFANAQTSAIGRALGFLGYGLVGTGVVASAEEMESLLGDLPTVGDSNKQPANSTKRPTDFRLMVVGDVNFNRDKSATVPVMLESRDTVDLVIPAEHNQFAGMIRNSDILHVKGWLNGKRLRLSSDQPTIEKNQAV